MHNPETLGEDAVVSRPSEAQNPFDETQEQTIDLAGKNDGGFDSNSSSMGVYNVELLNRFMDNEKGAGVDFTSVENLRKGVKDGSKVYEDEDVVVEKTAIEGSGNGISLFVEVFGPANGLVEVDKPVVLGEHVSRGMSSNHVHERNGALFSDNGENPSNEVLDLHCPILGVSQNGAIDWEAKGKNEAQEECKLSIGDLVWVKTKTQSWWPGLIVDPIHAPNDATKSDQRASLLVKYFGNGSCVWCSPLQLKPFVENFEQMLAQGNSMAFNGAVKKAANEFGSRVKSQMTCSCVLKEENQIAFNRLSDGNDGGKDVDMGSKMCRSDENSLNLFEPENFLAFVKFLALGVSMPGMLEFEATRNRLYAFYRALGHHQLPMHQLRGTTDAKDNAAEDLAKLSGMEVDMGLEKCRRGFSGDRTKNSEVRNGSAEVADMDNCQLASPASTEYKVSATANDGGGGGKSGKAYESRERRRSKYLSPPYTDLSFGQKNSPGSEENGAEGGKVVNIIDGQPVGSPSLVNSSGKEFQKKKKPSKAISGHNPSGVPSRLNVSSTSMLSELRFAALDCLHSKSRHFDHVESFFSGFRRLVFLDKSNAEIESNIIQTVPGVEVPMAMARGMVEDSTKSGERKAFAGSTDLDTPARSEALPNVTSKRRRRKKAMVTIDPSTIPAPGFSDVNGNPTNGPFMINFQKTGSLTLEGMSVLKKRRKKTSVLPDLNGSCRTPSSLAEDPKALNLINFVDKPEPEMIKKMDGTASVKAMSIAGLVDANGNNAKVGSFLKDVQVMGPCSTQDIAELCKEEGLKGASSLLNSSSRSEVTANHMETIGNYADQSSSFEKDIMDLLSPVGKPGPKNRKRKEKAPVDRIPDLNGKADPISPGNNLPAGESKPPRKRRRRNKPIAGFIPEISINYNKVQTHREASGSALLLRFAQGFPVPSKEALIATFCGFGRIMESETQALSGSIGAQVVFENSSDAGNAFKSLEKSSPFGPALINYRLHHLPAASSRVSPTSKTVEGFKMPARKPYGLKPNAGEAPDLGFKMPATKPYGLKPNAGEAPDLAVIRKNLEMMTSMLEKAGNDLSPETRAKLETEVKGLLKKVSTMAGSSSSTATS